MTDPGPPGSDPPDAPALRLDGVERHGDSAPLLALAHGAGAGMDSPFLEAFTEGLVAGGVRVARFEFPYMERRRREGGRRPPDRAPVLEATWEAVVGELAGRVGGARHLAIGGKSMGGRYATRVADRLGVGRCVCLGYPFHPPRKPETLRTAHLETLTTPTLILQGTRDPFGTPDEVAGYPLSGAIRVEWIEDGDHSLKPRKRSGRTPEQNLARAVELTVEFLTGR